MSMFPASKLKEEADFRKKNISSTLPSVRVSTAMESILSNECLFAEKVLGDLGWHLSYGLCLGRDWIGRSGLVL